MTIQSNSPDARGRIRQIPLPSEGSQRAVRERSERHQGAIRAPSDGNQMAITSPVLDESDQTPSGVRLTAPTIVLKTASTSAGAPIAGSLPPRTSASHRALMPRLSEQV